MVMTSMEYLAKSRCLLERISSFFTSRPCSSSFGRKRNHMTKNEIDVTMQMMNLTMNRPCDI